MKKNPDQNNDVLTFLDAIIPDTPETHLAERQELFRIALTQAMRNVRKRVGLTQEKLAVRLDVGQSWVSKLESANNDHTFESVLAYLNALGADFEVSILLNGQKFAVVAAKLGMTREEVDTAIDTVLESTQELQPLEELQPPEFALIPPEELSKCLKAQAVIAASDGDLWGTAA